MDDVSDQAAPPAARASRRRSWPRHVSGRGQSLRTRLTIALLVVGLIPLGIFVPAMGMLADREAAVRETRERALHASYVAEDVAGRLDHARKASSAMALPLAAVGSAPATWQRILEKSGDVYPMRVRLAALSPDGQPLASSDRRPPVSGAALPDPMSILGDHRTSWEVAWDVTAGTSILILYSPIVQDDGSLLGLLQTSAEVASLADSSAILSPQGPARAVVVDGTGRIIFHPDRTMMQARPVVNVPSRANLGAAAERDLLAGHPLIGTAPVPGTDWIVLVDTLDGNEPANATPWLGLAAAAVLATILAALAAIVLARSLTRPLAALTSAARALMGGDSSAPLPREPGQPAEVDDLVAAFAAMRADLGSTLAQLNASEERYRRLVEHVPDMMTRYELEPSPAFSYVSPSATEITGYSPADFYANPDLGYRIVHPDDRPVLDAVAGALVDGHVPPENQVLRGIRKDGRAIWMEQHMTPVRQDGRLVAVEGIVRDVTERIELSQAVERERAVLSAILASMRDGILLFDRGLTLSYSNDYASQLLSVDLGSLLGQSPWSVFEGFRTRLRDPEVYTQWWRRAVTELPSRPIFEVELTAPSMSYVLVQLLPITYPSQPKHGMVVILRDVTDVRRLVRMEERERIAMDLHDGVIQRLYALTLGLGAQARDQRDGAGSAPSAAEPTISARASLRAAIDSIGEAIEDVRSQVTSLQESQGDLRARLERLLLVVRTGTTVATELMVDREAESVIGPDDVVQVVFIVWEAASNAVRHAGATILAVSCRQIDRHVVVTVRDDGRGFDPRVQTHGTGRGLGNMARRARAIGADLNIDSGPGRGTEVRLALPIAAGGLVS